MKLTTHCPWLSSTTTQDPIGTFRDQSLAIVSEGGSLYTEERTFHHHQESENSESFCSEEQGIMASPA